MNGPGVQTTHQPRGIVVPRSAPLGGRAHTLMREAGARAIPLYGADRRRTCDVVYAGAADRDRLPCLAAIIRAAYALDFEVVGRSLLTEVARLLGGTGAQATC